MIVDEILAAVDAVVREAERRARGEAPDHRFDVPFAILEDLLEEIRAAEAAA